MMARSRFLLFIGGAMLLALLILELVPVVAGERDDEEWVAREQAIALDHLATAVADFRSQHAELDLFSHQLAAEYEPGLDPFEICATGVQSWSTRFDSQLAVSFWAGTQRLGWAGPIIAAATAPADSSESLLHDDHWWILRKTVALSMEEGSILEYQLRLAAIDEGDDRSLLTPRGVRRTVLHDTQPPGSRQWGDARRGLTLVEDVVLVPTTMEGAQPRLRFSVQIPPRSLQEDQRDAARSLVRWALLGLLILVITGIYGGSRWFWLAAWLVRGLWAQVDLFRLLATALPSNHMPANPSEPASLLDPAYFATTFAGGWLASGADVLVTTMLVVGTVAWLWHRYFLDQTSETPPYRRLVWLLPALVAVLAGLTWLWFELTANANARLLGLQVPLDAWTFWVLHAVILSLSLSGAALLVLLASRLLKGLPRPMRGAARPLWLASGLLVVVVFNYFVLSQAYGRAEWDWLRRKADQIVEPQDDWISFLLEDVLGEMAANDTHALDDSEASGGRGSLRRDVPAYRLWRQSAVRDLGLSCLVNVLDAEGDSESLFATGFLNDYAYEIIERSPWWSLAEYGEEGGGRIGVLLQNESRRYPTGQERILRGEIARPDGRGWLQLELPVQSLRISTLSSRLSMAQDAVGNGYRPRLEVDRPLLLLRGNHERWLDAGFGDLPDAAGDSVVAALRDGRQERAVIDIEGQSWLCLWASLPIAFGTTAGEGFLLGLQQRGTVAVLLDVGRLLLLDLVLLSVWIVLRLLVLRRWRWLPGFQGRLLLGYLGIGLVLLAIAGSLADRETFQRIDREARGRTRDGLVTALGQLRGLLAEQARALAASDYLADLLDGHMAGERPLGPIPVRQGMVFDPTGRLILDETLSDLDSTEAAQLLAAAREAPLVVMQQLDGLYLGVLIPIDLSSMLDPPGSAGAFFYRQRIDAQMLPSLADVVGGEVTLRVDGEVVDASHPGRVFSGESPLLAEPSFMTWLKTHPTQPRLQARASGLAFTGGVALPALTLDETGRLQRRTMPAVLSVEFPDRERDYGAQRRRMGLFLTGLITLLILTAFGMAMVLTWNIFVPLRVLLGATRQLAAGDFEAPLPPEGNDEVGRLSTGFQAMRDQIHTAREELEARERFLRVVLERVPVGVLVWDPQGKVAASNPAAGQILHRFYPGLEPGHDESQAFQEWSGQLQDDLTQHIRGGEGGELRSPDGRRTLRVGQAPLELGAGEPHRLVVCEDLTEFLAAQKLALNAELARQVAHEIKNPLTPIQLSVQLLQQAYEDQHPRLDSIVKDAVDRILEQVTLLRTIAGEFSLLGRPGELECSVIDLPALVRDVAAGYCTLELDRGPRVDVADQDVPDVWAHQDSLLKVLGNLMQNSLDAAGDPENLVVSVTWQVEPVKVTLVWADNGSGIAADVAGRLFDPYFSTKSKGTGLGLAICRNLADKMGGTITLANRDPEPGAVATLALPRADTID